MILWVDDNAGVLFIKKEVPFAVVRGVEFGNVYHSYEFTVHPQSLYDVFTNLYADTNIMWENVNIRTDSSVDRLEPIYVQFHNPNKYDKIPLFPNEINLALSNFKFRKIYIKNMSSEDITVKITLTSKNEYATP